MGSKSSVTVMFWWKLWSLIFSGNSLWRAVNRQYPNSIWRQNNLTSPSNNICCPFGSHSRSRCCLIFTKSLESGPVRKTGERPGGMHNKRRLNRHFGTLVIGNCNGDRPSWGAQRRSQTWGLATQEVYTAACQIKIYLIIKPNEWELSARHRSAAASDEDKCGAELLEQKPNALYETAYSIGASRQALWLHVNMRFLSAFNCLHVSVWK